MRRLLVLLQLDPHRLYTQLSILSLLDLQQRLLLLKRPLPHTFNRFNHKRRLIINHRQRQIYWMPSLRPQGLKARRLFHPLRLILFPSIMVFNLKTPCTLQRLGFSIRMSYLHFWDFPRLCHHTLAPVRMKPTSTLPRVQCLLKPNSTLIGNCRMEVDPPLQRRRPHTPTALTRLPKSHTSRSSLKRMAEL